MIYLVIIALFLVYADVCVLSAKEAVSVFLYSIIPSLLPFFIISKLLLSSSLPGKMSNSMSRIMFPLFGVSGAGAAALVPGLLCGYPIGAAACADLYRDGHLTLVEAERLSASTSNTGPFFVVGTVGAAFCRSPGTGVLLLVTHIIAGLIVGLLFKHWGQGIRQRNRNNKVVSAAPDPNGRVTCHAAGPIARDKTPRESKKTSLGSAVASSVKDVTNVGGFIIFFAVIIGIIRSTGLLATIGQIVAGTDYKIVEGMLSGLIEMTTGCSLLAEFGGNIIDIMPYMAFVIGFGGLSVHAQVISILNNAKIRALPFIIGKTLQGAIASLLTFIALKFESISNYISNSNTASTSIFDIYTALTKDYAPIVYVVIIGIMLTLIVHHFRLRLSSWIVLRVVDRVFSRSPKMPST